MAQLERIPDQFEYATSDAFEAMIAAMPADEKWELVGGRVIRAMVGARIEHHRIIGNVDIVLKNHFRQRGMPCDSLRETFWLREKRLSLQVFPDIMVHCGQIPPGAIAISDPLVLIEVTSDRSEAHDRFGKADLYRQLPSLQQYVVVARGKPDITSFLRSNAGTWRAGSRVTGLDATLDIPALELVISFAEVYRDVLSP
jgi:Uma2 family endonuclease